MTRFQKELSGELGPYWEKSARQELEKVSGELETGEITIDGSGVARNCIGRVVVKEVLEKLTYLTDKVNVDATTKAREKEDAEWIEQYRKNAKPASAEQIAEMRAAFGPGTTVVDVLTGQKHKL